MLKQDLINTAQLRFVENGGTDCFVNVCQELGKYGLHPIEEQSWMPAVNEHVRHRTTGVLRDGILRIECHPLTLIQDAIFERDGHGAVDDAALKSAMRPLQMLVQDGAELECVYDLAVNSQYICSSALFFPSQYSQTARPILLAYFTFVDQKGNSRVQSFPIRECNTIDAVEGWYEAHIQALEEAK